MSAYAIFDVEIRDLSRYQEYMLKVKPLIEAAGGRYLVRGGAHQVIEGDWAPRRLVLIEFPSMSAMEGFYDNPQYKALKALREACSAARLVAVEGVAAQ